jgi:hypothetical protein
MSECRADEYRRQADECRTKAVKAARDDERDAWLKMAVQWEMLAESTHLRTQEKNA